MLFLIVWMFFFIISVKYTSHGFPVKISGALGFV